MTERSQSSGKTTIAPDVLVSIAKLTTLGVPGVSKFAVGIKEFNQIFMKTNGEGVFINVENNMVFIDLYVILKKDVNVRDVCRNIQTQVGRAVSEMVGMEIGKVNVHVEDIDYSETEA